MDKSYVFTAFIGNKIIVRDHIHNVVKTVKNTLNNETAERIAIFDDSTGKVVDIDFRGTKEDVLARLDHHPMLQSMLLIKQENKPRGPGRPKLGVKSKEVSLLPRHWEWLALQRGGASATLRRLVESALKENPVQNQVDKTRDAAHAFMWDMGGNLGNFEEASRAFYRNDFQNFYEFITEWPTDIRIQTQRLVETYRHAVTQKQK